MRKNIKFMGAAAAALLAVAPVAATATSVFADVDVVTPSNNGTDLSAGGRLTSTLTVNDVNSLKVGQSVGGIKATLKGNLATAAGDLPVNVVRGQDSKVEVFDVTSNKVVTGNFVANNTYQVRVTNFYYTGLTATSAYTSYNASTSTPGAETVAQNGYSSKQSMAVSANFTPSNTSVAGTPYFYKGSNVVTSANLTSTTTSAKALLDAFHASGILASGGNAAGATANTIQGYSTQADIVTELEKQGITVNNDTDNTFDTPATSVTIPIKATALNGKVATLNVTYSFTDASVAPQIGQADSSKSTVVTAHSVYNWNKNYAVGSNFDVNDVVNAFHALNTPTSSRYVDVTVKSNNVDTSKDGNYKVVLTATNPAGHSTEATVNVTVGNPSQTYKTVHYVAGYGVNVWNINGNKVSFSGTRVDDGTTVKTFDTITVDGVEYTRIGSKDASTFIQTKYLGENYKASETKMSGELYVSYIKGYSVRLLDSNGKYTSQYVKDGVRYTVWAKKTINGVEMYRIGTQSQWIPAQYASLIIK